MALQREGRLPQYAHDRLVELQEKFDHLEIVGVFKHPEDLGIVAETMNPSFLVKKPSGGNRLVIAFAEVGQYAKPQSSLMPDMDSTSRQIARWKFVITTNLTSAFYQIPLSKVSMKCCDIVTHTQCAMGMPGSVTALDELMCRVLGDLLEEGAVAKIGTVYIVAVMMRLSSFTTGEDFSLHWMDAILDFPHLKLLLHPNQQLFLSGSSLTAPYELVHINFYVFKFHTSYHCERTLLIYRCLQGAHTYH